MARALNRNHGSGGEPMITIIDITVPAEHFPLTQVLETYPEVKIDLERLVPLQNSIVPYLWVSDGEEAAIETTLRSDPLVEEVAKLTETEQRTLYEIQWTNEIDGLIQPLIDANSELLRATGSDEAWELRLQFRTHDDLTIFWRQIQRNGVEFTLDRLYNPAVPIEHGLLSSEQQDALVMAYEQGYFDVPREISQQELGTRIGISGSSLSQRLRRGTARLIEEVLYPSYTED